MPIPLGVLAAAGAGGGAAGSYELIESTILTTTTASVTFSNIDQTYKHLQVRAVVRGSRPDYVQDETYVQFNGVTSGVYARHYLRSSGSSVVSQNATGQGSILVGWVDTANATSDAFGSFVFDVLDYASTSKNTTVRSLGGHTNPTDKMVSLASGLWPNTAAVTSMTLTTNYSFVSGSRFSLYGIKG